MSERIDLRELEASEYARWERYGPGGLTTLQLRGAQHAAERAGQKDDARGIAAQIADREAKGDTA